MEHVEQYRVRVRLPGGDWHSKSVKTDRDAADVSFDDWCGWAQNAAKQEQGRVVIKLVRTIKRGGEVVADIPVRERTYFAGDR